MTVVEELERLASLKERGLLDEAEFQKEKTRILSGASATPSVSEPLTRNPPPGSDEKKMGGLAKTFLWVVGLGVAFLIFGAIAGNSPEAKEKGTARDAIDLCWKEQQRKSFAPNTQRFVAGACEMMERNFTSKYGHAP